MTVVRNQDCSILIMRPKKFVDTERGLHRGVSKQKISAIVSGSGQDRNTRSLVSFGAFALSVGFLHQPKQCHKMSQIYCQDPSLQSFVNNILHLNSLSTSSAETDFGLWGATPKRRAGIPSVAFQANRHPKKESYVSLASEFHWAD